MAFHRRLSQGVRIPISSFLCLWLPLLNRAPIGNSYRRIIDLTLFEGLVMVDLVHSILKRVSHSFRQVLDILNVVVQRLAVRFDFGCAGISPTPVVAF